jgi:Glycosyltransferase sugar-binding region containing DXD motif
MTCIPKIIHYCFGLDANFGGKPWSLVHHACVVSAMKRIRPDKIYFYYEYEPKGAWWDLTKSLVAAVKVSAPRSIFGNELVHPAHRADVLRLQVLIETGGIYLDADVIVQQSFDSLLQHTVVLGTEGVGPDRGLANAVILAEPNASFLRRWYAEYNWFRSTGADNFWSEHSVKVPMRLAAAFPAEVTILPYDAFYWPLYTEDGIRAIFSGTNDGDLRGIYANHLWESRAWVKYLEQLTPGDIRRKRSAFSEWIRPLIADLPDDYGAPSIRDRFERLGRRAYRYVGRRLERLSS